MFNITKQGSSLLITSNDNSQFPWKDGQMSLPMNSVVYVIDESDYIAFRSSSNNDILFTALIDEIQINGTNVTKDDFILQFDNVANSAGGGGGSASAGVNSINGFQGDLTLKTVNGQSLIGSGNIEIEGGGGGSTAGVEAINIGRDIQDWTQKNGVVSFYTSFYDGSYDVSIGGTSFYGLKPIDSSIVLENAGGTVNGNFRCGIKVNEDNFKTINGESIFGSGDITIQGGGGSSDNGFTEWKNGNSISLGNGASSDEMGIAIGSTAESTGQSVAIGRNAKNTDYDQVAIGYGIKNDDVFYTNINDVIKGDVNKYAFILTEYGNYVRIPTEWTGTQSQYDALGEYYDNITYNIIEG